jgi:DNA-binding protein Alba
MSNLDDSALNESERAISTAVDTPEIVRNRFIKDVKVKGIKIGTESVTNEEGRTSNVSLMGIILTTKKKSK